MEERVTYLTKEQLATVLRDILVIIVIKVSNLYDNTFKIVTESSYLFNIE